MSGQSDNEYNAPPWTAEKLDTTPRQNMASTIRFEVKRTIPSSANIWQLYIFTTTGTVLKEHDVCQFYLQLVLRNNDLESNKSLGRRSETTFHYSICHVDRKSHSTWNFMVQIWDIHRVWIPRWHITHTTVLIRQILPTSILIFVVFILLFKPMFSLVCVAFSVMFSTFYSYLMNCLNEHPRPDCFYCYNLVIEFCIFFFSLPEKKILNLKQS